MNQNNCSCGCEHPQLTRLPIHGLELSVDTSALRPAPACRERVDHDLHIYIDGNRTESGDGLSPETAVNSYEDAVLALSRYDGCNLHYAHFHFADLREMDTSYPDITIHAPHYATFLMLKISGTSHESTRLGACFLLTGARVALSDARFTYISANGGWIGLYGAIAIQPGPIRRAAFLAADGGILYFASGTDIFFHSGPYSAALYCARTGCAYTESAVNFHTLGDIHMTQGFVYAVANSCVNFSEQTNFSDCASVVGRKYLLTALSSLYTGGLTLPGSLAGTASNGSVHS